MISLPPALLASATLALCLHGLLLGGLVWSDPGGTSPLQAGPPPTRPADGSWHPTTSHPIMLVRWRTPLASSPSDTVRTAEPPPTTPPLDVAPKEPAVPAEPAAQAATMPPIPTPILGTDTDTGAANGRQAYLPRSALDRGPEPLAPVVVPYPDGVQARGDRLTMQLVVYIDENGHVRRTEPQGARLEAAFERAANDAFLQALFRPGERQGQAVKARLLIELAFEATPADSARGIRLSAAGTTAEPLSGHGTPMPPPK